MSNPTLATKLVTLVKGIFGRKEAVPASSDAAQETTETTAAPTAAEKTRGEAPAEKAAANEAPAEESGKAEEAEPAGSAEAAPADGGKAEAKRAETTGTSTKAGAKETPAGKPGKSGPVEAAALVESAPAGESVESAKAEPEPEAESTKPKAKAKPAKAKAKPAEAEKAEKGQDSRTGSAAPATTDVSEESSAIAEELEVAEAHTKVTSDEVLEQVRKGAAPSAEDLAVPTYDELTLPSVRARLRKLTIEQVRDLRAYEVAHQGRSEFIKMYDNRISKLESGA
ncbi:hypothetical protein [Nocardiopsis quinghaiensis]|uniref:hypothetical protein n=1 Tax=Nocardiopsis quinghaiensis TaxID=464995 RepID=UPI001238DB35|nr:hypothetical protein [Nocardiopsis quinghaiensis]